MKKLMALVLTLALVLTMVPAAAMAASYDVDTYEEFVAAVKADATEINITGDFEVTMPEGSIVANWHRLYLAEGCTINGNGHTLTLKVLYNGSNGNYLFASKGNCTIKDITFDASGVKKTTQNRVASLTNGDTLENVTIIGSPNLSYGVTVGVPYGSEGKLTIENCTFKGISDGYAIYNNGGDGDGGDPVVLKITDSTFEDCEYVAVMRENGSEFTGNTVDDGKLNMTADTTITDNTFEGKSRIKFYNNNGEGNFTDNKILDESYFEFSGNNNTTDLDGNYFEDPETALEGVDGVKADTLASRAYLITVAGTENGIVLAPEMAKAGEKVTLDVTAAPGYALKALATNVQGVAVANNSFTMPASDITVTATFEEAGAATPIPETGDGMGLFVFAGLALVSMLGMVVLKKREQF